MRRHMLLNVELNINQAAAYLNCSVDTIRRRIRSGQLQARLDDRGRYMITFNGGEPAGADPQVAPPNPIRTEMPAARGNLEVAPGEWYDAWPDRRQTAQAGAAPPVPPPPPPVAPSSPSAPPVQSELTEQVVPTGQTDGEHPEPESWDEPLVPAGPERRDFAPMPPQRRATDPGLNEQVAKLREEREELIQELQMWRDEAMAAKVALEELRRLIPQTLTPRRQGGIFRRK